MLCVFEVGNSLEGLQVRTRAHLLTLCSISLVDSFATAFEECHYLFPSYGKLTVLCLFRVTNGNLPLKILYRSFVFWCECLIEIMYVRARGGISYFAMLCTLLVSDLFLEWLVVFAVFDLSKIACGYSLHFVFWLSGTY